MENSYHRAFGVYGVCSNNDKVETAQGQKGRKALAIPLDRLEDLLKTEVGHT